MFTIYQGRLLDTFLHGRWTDGAETSNPLKQVFHFPRCIIVLNDVDVSADIVRRDKTVTPDSALNRSSNEARDDD